MRYWPEKGTLDAEALVEPVRAALGFAYDLRRRNRDKDVPYDGYNIGADTLATNPPPDQMLTAANLQYSEEDQGRDAATEILYLAFQLGFEQGRRKERGEIFKNTFALRFLNHFPADTQDRRALKDDLERLRERTEGHDRHNRMEAT